MCYILLPSFQRFDVTCVKLIHSLLGKWALAVRFGHVWPCTFKKLVPEEDQCVAAVMHGLL